MFDYYDSRLEFDKYVAKIPLGNKDMKNLSYEIDEVRE